MMFLFPAIDLRGGQVVRLTRGDYDQQTTYQADPVEQALAFEQAGASWLHVVDLDGARSGEPVNLGIIERICAATKMNVEVGGGLRTSEAIDQLLEAGATRVILGTAALRNWEWFEELADDTNYSQRLVLGLDARDGKLAVAGWEETTGTLAVEVAARVNGWPLGAIVYTDIATDGTLAGPNYTALEEMTRATHIPIVASGGVGTLEHLRRLRTMKLQGVIVGKALYEGAFGISQAIEAVEGA